MKKKYHITEEEFEAIEDAVEDTLNLWAYGFIEVNNGHGSAMSMSKDTFFKSLKDRFVVNN